MMEQPPYGGTAPYGGTYFSSLDLLPTEHRKGISPWGSKFKYLPAGVFKLVAIDLPCSLIFTRHKDIAHLMYGRCVHPHLI